MRKISAMPSLFARQIAALTLANRSYRQFVNDFFTHALAADIGNGDITTALLGTKQRDIVTATIRAKASGILAGLAECELFWKQNGIRTTMKKRDGQHVRRGETIVELKGTAKAILTTERTGLNLLGRMSGIATATAVLVTKVGKNRVAATRKTPFGLLDCRAVVIGGGLPHRLNLADQILVKENHRAVDPDCWQRITTKQPFEVEADSAALAIEIATYYQHARNLTILLDNFTPRELKKLAPKLRTINPHLTLEGSGGITPKTAKQFLKTGVDYISLGWLTNSVAVLDLSLKIDN